MDFKAKSQQSSWQPNYSQVLRTALLSSRSAERRGQITLNGRGLCMCGRRCSSLSSFCSQHTSSTRIFPALATKNVSKHCQMTPGAKSPELRTTALETSPVSSSVHFSSCNVQTQSCLTLCNPMDGTMPGLPVHHQLPELAQTHVHRVSDAIQPSHPLSSTSPPA